MSIGLLALLDDVAAITKVAAASIDDIAGQALKAGVKTSALVIDDTAVTPRFVANVAAAEELSIVWRIAKGSLRNKLIYLLPAAIALSTFAPWSIAPLLMCGGAYLGYEAAEKIVHALASRHGQHDRKPQESIDVRVRSAIQTDFVLSAEIMTVTLQTVAGSSSMTRIIVLGLVGATMTALVYGAVALIGRLDDIGRAMARWNSAAARAFGTGLVAGVPRLMHALTVIGTAAMAWVGGGILVHGLHRLGWPWLDDKILHLAEATRWASLVVEAGCFAVVGLAVGTALMPVGALVSRLRGSDQQPAIRP